ncbi:hypothetical protein ABZ922_28655 [Streptomyces shenzhenensis]|uniref:hypothetical protein n=1 Tax=Streptomyces shenzhenensis TaxID=943815 RepID=UPI0033FCAF9B
MSKNPQPPRPAQAPESAETLQAAQVPKPAETRESAEIPKSAETLESAEVPELVQVLESAVPPKSVEIPEPVQAPELAEISESAEILEAAKAPEPAETRESAEAPKSAEILDPAKAPEPTQALEPAETSESAEALDLAKAPEPAQTRESAETLQAAQAPEPAETRESAKIPKSAETPESAEVPELAQALESAGPPKSVEIPEPAQAPEPTETSESAEILEAAKAPEPAKAPELAVAPKSVEIPEPAQAPEPVEISEPVMTLESAEVQETAGNFVGPVSPENPGGSESPAKSGRRLRSRRVALLVGSVFTVCALVGGLGYTAVTVRDADRDAGKPVWQFPETDEKGEPKSATGLSALFLPYGTHGYAPGPDLAEFGPDVEFNGEQATTLRKQSLKDLPRSTRRELEKLVDEQHIQGMAMRSYVVDSESYNYEDFVTVSVTLLRLENRTAVRRMSASFNKFLTAVDVFRKGPEIKGHKGTRCFLSPKGEKDDLDTAFCTADVGDVLVSVTADGPSPLDADFATEFFAAQLDRIDDPGQAV